MSVEAIAWVLNEAADVPSSAVAALIGLANHATPDGRNAYPTQKLLARYARKSDRQVRRDLADLEARGLIRRGDQRIVEHIPIDRRPVVYDLVMARRKDLDGRTSTSARTSTSGRTPVTKRPDAHVRTGRTPTSYKPYEEPSRTVLTHDARASEPRQQPQTPPPRPDGLTEIPDDFQPTDSMRRWSVATFGTAIDVEYETAQFISHYRSTGTRRKSWPDVWQKWIRQSAQQRQRPLGGTVVPFDRSRPAGGTDANLTGHAALIAELSSRDQDTR